MIIDSLLRGNSNGIPYLCRIGHVSPPGSHKAIAITNHYCARFDWVGGGTAAAAAAAAAGERRDARSSTSFITIILKRVPPLVAAAVPRDRASA